MRKWLGIMFMSLVLGWPMVSSAVELGGGYAVDVPEGWVAKTFPGSPYNGLFGTTSSEGFTPNINIQEEPNTSPMDEYVKLNLDQLEQIMKAVKVSQDPFSAKNVEGVKLVTHTQFQELKLRQIFYFFDNSAGQKVVVTATASRQSDGKMDSAFDKIMNTFKVK